MQNSEPKNIQDADMAPPALNPSTGLPAWESGRNKFIAYFITFAQIMFRPKKTFVTQNFPGYGKLLLFYLFSLLLFSGIFLLLSYVWIKSPQHNLLLLQMITPADLGTEPAQKIASLLWIFIYLLVDLFISALILHACLTLTKANNRGWQATFRYMAYLSSASFVFTLIIILALYQSDNFFVFSLIIFGAVVIWKIYVFIEALQASQAVSGYGGVMALIIFSIVLKVLDKIVSTVL